MLQLHVSLLNSRILASGVRTLTQIIIRSRSYHIQTESVSLILTFHDSSMVTLKQLSCYDNVSYVATVSKATVITTVKV